MKKTITLFLTTIVCLSLVACGNNKDTTDTSTMPESAVEPKLISVEITMNNWHNYFELCEYTDFKENSFGEIDDAQTYWSLVSKDEYTVDTSNCDVTLEFTYTQDTVASTIDMESKTVIYGEVTDNWTSEPKVETMNGVGQYIGEKSNERYGEYLNSELFDMEDEQLKSVFDRRIVDITVIRINGTFSYYE